MRILLLSHFPIDDADSPLWLSAMTDRLAAEGHQTHCLVVDQAAGKHATGNVRGIICDPRDPGADLAFPLPGFSPGRPGRQQFADLSDNQLAAYRDFLRGALDRQIEQFNPHLIHADAVWIWGHLALEAGPPYVLTASVRELSARQSDPRFQRFADEAAENAGRILAADEALRDAVLTTFDVFEQRVIRLDAANAEALIGVYQQVQRERYGGQPDW